ncbi:LytTr DNA-binding domain protein [Kordia sp. SMS9]|uniref:LytTR family DNA-binding domain-containing protein n=1 Tax=Kordia sp. SMS9 TaxID=2282170 RepID=UPI000E0CDECD|nr:LytTR family DNA-binding domain-containing protein [Kordia sp. SMS9]AXG67962.1 LytTr DNA-binding domain protein [Kordia sp. SMS9]
MSSLKFKKTYLYHFLAAFIIALWLTIFLIIIAPFDASEVSFKIRLLIMPVYGLITFIGYIVLIPFQDFVIKKKHKQLLFEIFHLILFNIIVLIGSYLYYKSSIVNGDYSFTKFTFEVYYPIFFILLPIIIFAKWFLRKQHGNKSSEKIILKGDNKLDILQIENSDLVCISSADNYVEVNYLIDGILHKKLLRTTLKNIELQFPVLLKVHRSHLINPDHFKEWKSAAKILLTGIEVPVSKNYKNDVLALNHSSLKTIDSPQSQ